MGSTWVDVRRSGEEALNAISAIQGESKEILDASLEKTRRVLNAEGEKPL
ncbi:MAG: hypothetical protein HXS48_22485 [Theionarchaea archaeon]|nr:hypothetical protein [Theionarchaea archaeon]